jgi:hypothetical protein
MEYSQKLGILQSLILTGNGVFSEARYSTIFNIGNGVFPEARYSTIFNINRDDPNIIRTSLQMLLQIVCMIGCISVF